MNRRQMVSLSLVVAAVLAAIFAVAAPASTRAAAQPQHGSRHHGRVHHRRVHHRRVHHRGNAWVRPTIPTTPSVASYWGVKRGNTRTYYLTAEQFTQKIANFPIQTGQFWGCGAPGIAPSTPGPTLLAWQGERVRLVITNRLPVPTSVHPHGLHQPNVDDGVSGVDFTPIQPGQTRTYPAFTPGHPGTFAYHTHTDTATQEPRGLAGLFIVLPRRVRARQNPQVDVGMTLQTFNVQSEGALDSPMPDTYGQFPYNTINGKTGDASGGPITIHRGDLVQIRLYNASEKTHSMHLRGHDEVLVAINGHPVIPRRETTQAITPGEFFTLQFRANNPGNWVFRCAFPSHQANDGLSGYEGAPVGMTRIFHYAGYKPVPPQYFSYQG